MAIHASLLRDSTPAVPHSSHLTQSADSSWIARATDDLPLTKTTKTIDEDSAYFLTLEDLAIENDYKVEITSIRLDSGNLSRASQRLEVGDEFVGFFATHIRYKPGPNQFGDAHAEIGLLTTSPSGEQFRHTIVFNVTDTPEPGPALIGSDDSETLSGSDSNDHIEGKEGDDLIKGNAGDDTVSGGDGYDTIFAGPDDKGADFIYGNTGNDLIGGGEGDDTLVGGNVSFDFIDDLSFSEAAGWDTMFGGAGNDVIVAGGAVLDVVFPEDTPGLSYGNTSNNRNVIWAGSGDDSVIGDDGDDLIGASTGADYIYAMGGADTMYGGDGDDTLFGGNGSDILYGAAGDDFMHGGAQEDTLYGGAGNDILEGHWSLDMLWGGAGDDTLYGGLRDDTFGFVTGFGNDIIADFESGDTIDLTGIEGLTLAAIQTAATYENGNTKLTIGEHGTIILRGVDETEFQAFLEAGQILVG